MFSKEKKTNWKYIAIILAVAALGAVTANVQHDRLRGDMAMNTANVFRPPVPMPTEIDANFLTQINECFIPIAAFYGYALRLTSGFRTMEEQDQLYEQGRTVDGHIISWAPKGKSIHNYGFAVDVVDRWKGFTVDWKKLAKIGAYCGLKQVDDPHFEYRGGLTTEQFEFGMRPQPLVLPCARLGERASVGQSLSKEDIQSCGVPEFLQSKT